jgi:hypothetical protein
MLSGAAQAHTVRIEARERLRIQISAIYLPRSAPTLLRVWIKRLDDLLVFQQDFSTTDYAFADGRSGLEVEFSALALAPAIYRLDVELRATTDAADSIFAQSSSIFEVYSLSPPAGGKPMLYYPVSGTVTPT